MAVRVAVLCCLGSFPPRRRGDDVVLLVRGGGITRNITAAFSYPPALSES